MTPAERGDLAERMLPIAASLASVVHGDGDQRDIARILNQLDQAEQTALIVVLAALVDPEQPINQALGWITWDEHGRTAPRPTAEGTVRQHARQTWGPVIPPDRRSRAIVHDTAELAAQGCTRADISERLGITWGYVTIAHSREGVRLPELAA